MRLNDTTDVAMRIMIYATSIGPRLFTIDQVVEVYGLPRSTVMKVVNALTKGQFLSAQRGRAGGLRLSRDADAIRLGDLVRHMETDFDLVECMRPTNRCTISGCCKLISPLAEARTAFLATLDQYTVRDIALAPAEFGIAGS